MADFPYIVSLPPDMDLADGFQITWDAVDSTGATVANVTVSGAAMWVTNIGSTSALNVGPFMLVPGPGA